MESRLSAESLPAIYDSGCSGLAFDRSAFESNIFWDRVDFDKVLASSDPALVISELSTQRLYYSLIERGPAECLEVLAHISKEQFLRILDYDVWRRDEFVPQRVLYWVDLLRQVSSEKAYEQFRDLEEEYQLSTLSPYLKIYDQDAYEQMTDVDQDRLQRLPGDALFYSIETQDQDIHDSIVGLINSISAHDMNYAIALIAHSAYLPQNESADTAAQFRKARLEEDGFISFEESLTCFAELDPVTYKSKLNLLVKSTELASTYTKSEKYFLDQVLAYASSNLWDSEQSSRAQQGFMSLANNLCTATQIDADDLTSLKFIFTNAKALCSLGLDYLADGNVQSASEILLEKFPKDLFRIGLSLIRTHQRDLVTKICDLQVPDSDRFKRYFYQQRNALMLDWIDRNLLDSMGFETCEVLKGIFNRFPQIPNEITSEDSASRISFFPISNMSELRTFENITKRMASCFQTKHQS